MKIDYEFINRGSKESVTQVFVANRCDAHPVRQCDGSAVNGSTYRYQPWQCLTASQNASESFAFADGLAMEARIAGSGAGLAPSRRTPLQAGCRYLVYPGVDALYVTRLASTSDDNGVAVTAVALGLEPFALAIDWYLDNARVGTTLPLGAAQAAGFASDGTLLLRTVDPLDPMAGPEALEASALNRYRPPTSATRVRITLGGDPPRKPVFSFSPQ